MPRREDLDTIIVIGAGPIVIGQASEFDYSGTQACKALRAEGYRVVLINSNPATIMTDPETADAVYIEPVTPEVVEAALRRERAAAPHARLALLPTMGGQTALNVALALHRAGALERLDVEMIGAQADVIDKAEDRLRFREAMAAIGLESPRSRLVGSLDEALDALALIGLPAIIRPSFTLGGQGGGVAETREAFEDIVRGGLRASPADSVLVEESILGWKEFEMEVVRDRADNCVIICAIENVDPMGVHTGDSITVAPALTLTDKEYQRMRDASLAVLREIGVETGGSNVQFAVNPRDGRMVVIEMNPRVSRSSALASKATGFPIAKVAARLAIGYTLDEIQNDITRITPASFEPAIDYVVTKLPRFAFEKFPGSPAVLTTSMKSVGEAMAMGGSFAESLQKGLRALEIGLTGLDEVALEGVDAEGGVDGARLLEELRRFSSDRLLRIAQAMRHGLSTEAIHAATHVDPWFLAQIEDLVLTESRVRASGLPEAPWDLLDLKAQGFSNARLATLTGLPEAEIEARMAAAGVAPVYHRVDTCAAELPSHTPYLYSCYEGDGINPVECESRVSDRRKIIILGGGPNRIGQGIEFDYCCVHACYALREAGYETIMVNCNPETVSTDYDTSDRLYFEPLTHEDVLAICRRERSLGTLEGVIVQLGGQTPLKLSRALEAAGIPILGTAPDAIDLAEDRQRFQRLLQDLGLTQPPNGVATTAEEAVAIAERVGYPVVLRPSYVLGGRAMEIVEDRAGLERYIHTAVRVSGDAPVLVDFYLSDATEVDVDALCDGEGVYVAGVMEHIEEAGVHSGDSACALPPHALPDDVVAEMKRQTVALARALGVVGLMNVQFAAQGGRVFILEVNPRASRTVPFVAKATGVPVAKIAARLMAGAKLSEFELPSTPPPHVAVKEAVLPFGRFPGVTVALGPEMRSTGEVMGVAEAFPMAYAKALLGAGLRLEPGGRALLATGAASFDKITGPARRLAELGYALEAVGALSDWLTAHGVPNARRDLDEAGLEALREGLRSDEIQLLCTTRCPDLDPKQIQTIREWALGRALPSFTTLRGFTAGVDAIAALQAQDPQPIPINDRLGVEA